MSLYLSVHMLLDQVSIDSGGERHTNHEEVYIPVHCPYIQPTLARF